MSQQRRPKWMASGVVEAPVQKVFDELLGVRLGAGSGLKLSPVAPEPNAEMGKERFIATMGQPTYGKTSVEVNRINHSLAVQGEFWYQGVHTVEQDNRGSLVVYRIYNVAPATGRWIVPFLTHGQESKMKDDLRQTLQVLAARLHCKAYLLKH